MIKKNHTAEDSFFGMLECAELYLLYKDATDEERSEMDERDADKVIAYAVYLDNLNSLTIKETGKGL